MEVIYFFLGDLSAIILPCNPDSNEFILITTFGFSPLKKFNFNIYSMLNVNVNVVSVKPILTYSKYF